MVVTLANAILWLSGAAAALATVLIHDQLWLRRARRGLPPSTRRAIRRERAARLELPRLYTHEPRDTEDTAP